MALIDLSVWKHHHSRSRRSRQGAARRFRTLASIGDVNLTFCPDTANESRQTPPEGGDSESLACCAANGSSVRTF
jgi:hypothetical protein